MDRTGVNIANENGNLVHKDQEGKARSVKERVITKELSFSSLSVQIIPIGQDLEIILSGGERPHIGCTVIAVPRPSLKGDKSNSCTSSVMNLIGHKDEQICRYLAEALCKKVKTTVVCTGGFHIDNITEAQIKEVLQAVKEIAEEI